MKNTAPFSPAPGRLASAMKILRARREKYGDLVIPRNVECPVCLKYKVLTEFPRIDDTGIVRNVMDCLCTTCTKENKGEFARLARVVCATCKEVVIVLEPGKERTGYVWKERSFAHVPFCPACTNNPRLAASPVAEKIAFYKANGIPYETPANEKQ